jgi:hypothetical protein
VVSKRRDAPYRSGECRDWRKVKTLAWRESNRDRWRLFGHGHCLVELGYGAEDLSNEGRGRRVVYEGAGAIGGNDLDPPPLQHAMPGLLHDQVAGEAVGRLDDDGANPVSGDALEHQSKLAHSNLG